MLSLVESVWTMVALARPVAGTPEERELVAASRDGDGDAFEQLVRLHQHRVFRLSSRFFGHREDIEDAAQETFLAVWRKLSTYRGDAPFEHWLTRVCLNACYQKLRGSRIDTRPLDEAGSAEAPAHDPAASVEVERLLSRLDPRDRFMLLLLDGEGWSVAEIAVRLGWSKANVKVRAHRARKQLRRFIEEGPR